MTNEQVIDKLKSFPRLTRIQIWASNDHRDPGGGFNIKEFIHDKPTDTIFITFEEEEDIT